MTTVKNIDAGSLLPMCSANIHSQESIRYRFLPRSGGTPSGNVLACLNRARYEIDGKPYCKRHAGHMALKILLDMETNKGNEP